MLILPVCEAFSRDLEKPSLARVITQHDARFVASIADMSAWLTTLNAGLFSQVVLVVPYEDEVALQSSLWRLIVNSVHSEVVN